MGRDRRNFTLIEVFLAVAVLALVAGLIMVRTQPLIDQYRYQHNLSRLKEEIYFTRRLARSASADIELHLKASTKGVIGVRKTDEPLSLPRTIATPMLFSHLRMKGASPVLITFTGSGWVKEEKILTLYFKDKSETLTFSNNP